MKLKIFKAVFLLAPLLMVEHTIAQSSITFDAGQLFSKYKFIDSQGNDRSKDYSYNLSGTYNLGYQFAAQSGLFFRAGLGMKKMGSSLVYDELNYNWSSQYLSLNVGAGYILNKYRFKPYVSVTPFYSYLLKATQSTGTENYNIKQNNSIKKNDFGLQFIPGVKMTLSDFISVYTEFNYILGLQNIEKNPAQKLYNRGFSINVGVAATIVKTNKSTK